MSATAFASVKLPASLVDAARQSAAPMRRSVASQIEYWSTLGQAVEHSGLTAQEAKAAIERYEASARPSAANQAPQQAAQETESQADQMIARMLAVHADGSLARRVRDVVAENASKAIKLGKSSATSHSVKVRKITRAPLEKIAKINMKDMKAAA